MCQNRKRATMTLEFLLTSLIVIVVPGTGVIYTLAHGLGGGTRAALAAVAGCTFGIVPHLAASILGLAAVLHASAVLFQAVKFAGVAYLLYLAWTTLKDDGALRVAQDGRRKSVLKIALNGFLINILNPKLSLFFLAFLPQFVPAGGPAPLFDMALLGAVFMALTAVVFTAYGTAAAFMRTHVMAQPTVMTGLRCLCAGAFGLLSLRLALAEK